MKPKEGRGLRGSVSCWAGVDLIDFRISVTDVLETRKGLENWVYDFGLRGSEGDVWDNGDCLGASRLLKMPSRDGFQGVGLGGAGAASEGIPLNKSSSMSTADFFDLRISAYGLSPSFAAELCCFIIDGFDDLEEGAAGREKVCCSFGAVRKVGGGRTLGSGFLSGPGFAHLPNSSGAGRNRFGLRGEED